MSIVTELSKQAYEASAALALLSTQEKNTLLHNMAETLRENAQGILVVNQQEVAREADNGLSPAMLDRLTLNPSRIEEMAAGIETLVELDDPVGKVRKLTERPNGILVNKMRVPLGVVCMIYEARPNVTADAGALCFKSGNACILRGGREALQTIMKIAELLQQVLVAHGLPKALITVIPNPDRSLMQELMQQREYISVIIPRGGEGLINYVTEHSKVPVIQHFKGVCHLYVDKDADLDMALALLENGKTQRTGVCNALEGLIVHKDIAGAFLPKANALFKQHTVAVNCDAHSVGFFDQGKAIPLDAFGEEYLRLEIAVRVVDSYDDALAHIRRFGSNHTEVICTENKNTAEHFLQVVDASVVMVNASSRFSDGGQLGLGAEIGIATTKLHAYGPMGLESLTTEKFTVCGNGQTRD